MKIFKNYILLFLFSILSSSSFAQDTYTNELDFEELTVFAWETNTPIGNAFINASSFRGGHMEFQRLVKDNVTLGFDFSWQSLYQYDEKETYNLNATTAVTTDLYRYNFVLPFAITTHYYFPTQSIFQPYVGIGGGFIYSKPRLYANIYELEEEDWGLFIRPEIGTIIKFSKNADMGLVLGARYTYANNNAEKFDINNMQTIGINLGLVWMR